jgi:hypothetical protein
MGVFFVSIGALLTTVGQTEACKSQEMQANSQVSSLFKGVCIRKREREREVKGQILFSMCARAWVNASERRKVHESFHPCCDLFLLFIFVCCHVHTHTHTHTHTNVTHMQVESCGAIALCEMIKFITTELGIRGVAVRERKRTACHVLILKILKRV